MLASLSQLNPLKRPIWRLLPLLAFAATPALAQPSKAPASKPSTMMVGVFDEDALFSNRSDFPTLATKVLPQVIAKRHLSLVVTRQGARFGLEKVAHVDVTPDLLALLRKIPPPDPGTLTGEQFAAAQRCLSALDALEAATSLGSITQDDYLTRLTNAYVVYKADMSLLPNNLLQMQLAKSMQGFLDARQTWDRCLILIDMADTETDAEFDLKRQQLPPALAFQLVPQETQIRQERHEKAFKSLYEVWAQASRDLATAHNLLPRPGGRPPSKAASKG